MFLDWFIYVYMVYLVQDWGVMPTLGLVEGCARGSDASDGATQTPPADVLPAKPPVLYQKDHVSFVSFVSSNMFRHQL